ncbi:MAG TPA: hypothetical protein VG939_05140 [Caulobacteraceae bacterium]|nr:hypothetical protein [Caulobacteraceae bacterium]
MRALVAGLCLVFALAGPALAFGTVNIRPQSAEHEKITRRALECAPGRSPDTCFEPATLDQLAGRPGTFGAIGYPDSSTAVFHGPAHCDNGDAPGGLAACRDWMEAHIEEAVGDAAGLLGQDGRIRSRPVSLRPGCVWILNLKGRAKCNVLQDFGIALHAAQDFYAHSNWSDDARETDPPGLGRSGPADVIGLRASPPFPPGLVSGCFSLASSCAGRITHEQLNKDTGPIGEDIGPGTTPRGARHDNFRRAVLAAVADTSDKWALLRERLVARYGRSDGERMICALTRDDPTASC